MNPLMHCAAAPSPTLRMYCQVNSTIPVSNTENIPQVHEIYAMLHIYSEIFNLNASVLFVPFQCIALPDYS